MNKNNRGFISVEALTMTVMSLVAVVVVAAGISKVLTTADGKRVGVLTKFSNKGAFFKSYEGELNMGGLRNKLDKEGNQHAVANVWQFSCSNPQIAEKLDNLVGKEVAIKYHQNFTLLVRETSYDVVSVEEVKNK